MEDRPFKCPGCAGELQQGQVAGKREYLCTSCGGAVFTIIVLRQLEGGLAQHIWTAPSLDGGGSPQPCAFCSLPMQAKAAEHGHIWVCRPCEAVWLDKEAYEALPAAPDGTGPKLAAQAVHCPQCGAPVPGDCGPCCKYCGAALQVPTRVVVLPTERPASRPGVLGGRLLADGALGAIVDRLTDGLG